MAVDTFICGCCQVCFYDMGQFIEHKKADCTGQTSQQASADLVQEPDMVAQQMHVEQAIVSELPPGTTVLAEVTTEQLSADADVQIVVQAVRDTSESSINKVPARRKGRPRKSEQKPKPVKVEPEVPPTPEKSKDGRLLCGRCKRTFTKERHFNTHKCLAVSDYVDITKKEVLKIESSEEELSEEEREAQDEEAGDADFRIPKRLENAAVGEGGSREGAPRLSDGHMEDLAQVEDLTQDEEDTGHQTQGNPSKSSRKVVVDIPIFDNAAEKEVFEESLNIDLSGIDHMFKIHVIEQNVNENAPPPGSRSSSQLCIYSCNTCDKMFKTLSHMRLHCLTHTDLRPFKCHRCDYSSNCKGNLYTHMRKHTGQYYRCNSCDFKTVNKTHLMEHESTHSSVKQRCNICKKDYNTIKSLINHVRKYHTNKAGREYLNSFQGKHTKGAAVLHQCHICNRKFKKKIDRDRHLFVHDIQGNPNVFRCELCDYSASRKTYMEKHFRKHRVVYTCAVCLDRFPSTIRLNHHLTQLHLEGQTDNWEELFQQSINASLFLPEPDGSVDFLEVPEATSVDQVGMVTEDNLESSELTNPSEDVTLNQSNAVADEMPNVASEDGPSEAINMEHESEDVKDDTVLSVAPSGEEQPPVESLANALEGISEETPAEVQGMEVEGVSTTDEGQVEVDAAAVDQPDPDSVPDLNDSDLPHTNVSLIPRPKATDNLKDDDICKRLKYQPMTLDIFHKLRETFGSEECEFCGRLFYSRVDFDFHIKTHTGEKPFACEKCSYRSITRDNLKRHVEKEHDNVQYACGECSFVGNSRTQLWHHQQKHKDPVVIECPECQMKVESVKKLKAHIRFKHEHLVKDLDQIMAGFYKGHSKIGRKTFKCPHCDRVFLKNNSDLQKHIWIHEGIKPYKCPLCPHACRSKNNLAAHMLRHSNEKPYLCPDCGKAYKSKTALRWHVRSHKDGKIFKCNRCPYEATQKSHLKRHMETHDIVKRFVCGHCDYSANTLGYMKIHYTRHHKGLQYRSNPAVAKAMPSDTKVFRCLSCDYLFGNLSDMKRHLKIRHHIQVEDMRVLESTEVMQLAPAEHAGQHIPQSEVVQVLQVAEASLTSAEEEDATSALQSLQYSAPSTDLDERTASAVNILQQIIDMSQQGAFGQQQEVTVQSESGQSLVAVNPETIIVQQEGEEVVVASTDGSTEPGQYVIEYVTPHEPTVEESAESIIETQVEQLIQPAVEVTEVMETS